ncbi:MAG: 2-dehydropantoate 2-reductase [Desulfobacterales bacterium]|nr:2-dehydropantoate 2-reductase [Desulfobacterales bacterium]
MNNKKIAVVGAGATGTVLAAALLSGNCHIVLVGTRDGWEKVLKQEGLHVAGAVSFRAPVACYSSRMGFLKDFEPDMVFLATKTFHLPQVIRELKAVVSPGTAIIATQNGLGPEDMVAENFGAARTFRMSLNFGARFISPGQAEVTFFNRPNHIGGLLPASHKPGLEIAGFLTACGLDTLAVEDIKLYVWQKMIMKCTMASICAVTDRTIKGALGFLPTRMIAESCFKEAMAVAKAMGYDLGQGYREQALGYLEKVGEHKDSMCRDIANRTPTEIDFLGGKIVEYGRMKGIPTPFFATMTNLVKALEDSYSKTRKGLSK